MLLRCEYNTISNSVGIKSIVEAGVIVFVIPLPSLKVSNYGSVNNGTRAVLLHQLCIDILNAILLNYIVSKNGITGCPRVQEVKYTPKDDLDFKLLLPFYIGVF